MIIYLTRKDLANFFGVTPSAVSRWMERYPSFPAPDAMIGDKSGWLPHREQEIRRWETTTPRLRTGRPRRQS